MWETVISVLVFVVFAMATIGLAFGAVYRKRSGRATTSSSLQGKTVLITGASAGIGKEAAKDIARRGARVIMACRNLKKALDVANEIEASTGSKLLLLRELDTSSLASVRAFASRILAEEDRIDVLVLNAGMSGNRHCTYTSDGLELTMATNYFGHFLLTNLLLGLLKASRPSRVVVTASMAHSLLKTLDIENLNYKKDGSYWSHHSYAQSKVCNILFARHLATMLKDTGVVVNSLCPGYVSSEIFRKSSDFVTSHLYNYLATVLAKTEEQGAQTIIHLAASEEAGTITGEFFEDCKVSDNATNLALDDGLAKKLWEASETVVGLQLEEQHY